MEYNKEHIERLMLEKLLGTASPADMQYLDELMEKDEQLRRLWEDMQAKMSLPLLRGLDEHAAWKKWNTRYGHSRRILLSRSLAAAAVVSAIIAALYFFRQPAREKAMAALPRPHGADVVRLVAGNGEELLLSRQNSGQAKVGQLQMAIGQGKVSISAADQPTGRMNTLFVPPGYDYRIELPDGTEVWLNAASSLRFSGEVNTPAREVYLEGEAYFKVSKDALHPFLVHIGSATIRVLGTEFNVNGYGQNLVKTALVAGSVSLEVPNVQSLLLKPGYMGIVASGKFSQTPFNSQHELAWMQGRYYFKRTSLRELAGVIFRCYNVQVIFDDPHTADIEISGLLRKSYPLTDFLNNLAITSGVRYYFRDGILHLK